AETARPVAPATMRTFARSCWRRPDGGGPAAGSTVDATATGLTQAGAAGRVTEPPPGSAAPSRTPRTNVTTTTRSIRSRRPADRARPAVRSPGHPILAAMPLPPSREVHG